MRRLTMGLVLLAATTTAHAADRVELPGLYGNTWELRRPEEIIWIYLNADGSWDGIFAGTFHNGLDWRTIDGNTCFFSTPDKTEKGMCFRDLAQRKPGDSWQLNVVGRDKVWEATVYKGRAVPPVAKP